MEHQVIECRSDEQENDDEVCATYDRCAKELRRLLPYGGSYHRGERRTFIANLRDRCGSVIAGEQGFYEAFAGRARPAFQLSWTLCN